MALVLTPPRIDVVGTDLSGLVTHLHERLVGSRFVLGLAGPPGAGKSSLAAALVERMAVRSVVVPLDGFHLADAELARQRLLGRKGVPETFDGWGYAALLARLRERPDHVVYAPSFERTLEQPLAGAVAVGPEVELVVTEGNYLLLDRPEWHAARALLDEVWYVDSDTSLRLDRLVARHVAFGKPVVQARRWVADVDGPNAVLVADSRDRADLVVDVSGWETRGP